MESSRHHTGGCRPAPGSMPWIWAAGHLLIPLPWNLASDSSLFPEAEIVLNSLQKTSIQVVHQQPGRALPKRVHHGSASTGGPTPACFVGLPAPRPFSHWFGSARPEAVAFPGLERSL